MGKRILKIPKHYANLLPRVTLQIPSKVSSGNCISLLTSLPVMITHLAQPQFGPWPCGWYQPCPTVSTVWEPLYSWQYNWQMLKISRGGYIHRLQGRTSPPQKGRTPYPAWRRQVNIHPKACAGCVCGTIKALDRGCAGTIAIQKLIRYLATTAFNDRYQYCTRSIIDYQPQRHLYRTSNYMQVFLHSHREL